MLKRPTSVFIVLALLCALIVSCSPDIGGSAQTLGDPGKTETAEAETTSRYADALPEGLDFGGYNFRVLAYDKLNLSPEYGRYLAPQSEVGDIINDTAYIRNCEVEERLNVTVSFIGSSDALVSQKLMASVLAVDDEYDIVIIFGGSTDSATNLVKEKAVLDLHEMPYMNLTAEWYPPNITRYLTVADKLYATSSYYLHGDLSPFYMVFNKKLAADHGTEDLYATVKAGDWTWDCFLGCIKGVYSDLNGDGKSGYGDRFGYFNNPGLNNYFMIGFDIKTVNKLPNRAYEPLLSGEKLVSALEKLRAFNLENPDVYGNAQTDPSNTFMDGNALFATSGTAWLNFRAIDSFDFGVIPTPKLDENQEEYSCGCFPDIFCVPTTVKNLEACGAVIEALSAASLRDLVPVYTELYFNEKILRDRESIEIYELMRSNATVDFSRYYDFSNSVLKNFAFISEIINSNSLVIASKLAEHDAKLKPQAEAFFADVFGIQP